MSAHEGIAIGVSGLGHLQDQLGGSWVVISRVISPLIWLVTLLITPLISTHEPPRTASPSA